MLQRSTQRVTRSANEYICVSCRHRLSSAQPSNSRWHSNVTATAGSDSWFDTINQINEEFPSKKPGTRPRESSWTPKQERGVNQESEKTAQGKDRSLDEGQRKENDGTVTQKGASTRKPAPDQGSSQEAKASPKSASSGASNSTTPRPLTIAEKVREAKERAKWGGSSETKSSRGRVKNRLSHDSLRKADKVSAEGVIETAVNVQPYGFKLEEQGIDAEDPVEAIEEAAPAAQPAASSKVPGNRKTAAQARMTRRKLRIAKRLGKAAAKSSKPRQSSSRRQKDDESQFQTLEVAMGAIPDKQRKTKEKKVARTTASKTAKSDSIHTEVETIQAGALQVEQLNIPQPPVPYLEYGLDRVLFSPGVHQLQDPTSRVYNFDPYLQKIMPVMEFDFNALKEYKTSSQDRALADLAHEYGKRYIGSTSSMTGVLAHFHYLLSSFRPLNLQMLSRGFSRKNDTSVNFTRINRAPSAIFLRRKHGSYAIDADKEYDSGNVLMLLGKSMELLLTLPKSDYERYRKNDPREVSEEQKTSPESYQYSTLGDFLMRSQLDAYDPRLPDNGTFDLKTRAVVSVRMDARDYEPMTGYELYSLLGKWGSFEREYYDMMRATMLKYMLQARMGRMNGIFVAYHNVERIFGFQYVPMRDMDIALHGQSDPALGDQEFRVSLDLLNKMLDRATAKFPDKSLRIHFETRQEPGVEEPLTSLHMFAEPMEESDIDNIQSSQKAKIQEFERTIMGLDRPAPNADQEATDSQAEPIETDTSQIESASAAETSEASKATDSGMADAENAQPSQTLEEASSEDSTSTTSSEELKPLFYASVLVKSKVNGAYIQEERPDNLGGDDDWSVEYLLQEYEIGRHEWAAYEDMKTRRRNVLRDDKEDADNGDADSGGKDKTSDYYIRFLRDMAAKGRQLRDRIDALEAGKPPVLVGQPLPRVREKVEDVDEYLSLLYKNKTL